MPAGLFEHSHMHYELDRSKDIEGEPSLAHMVEKAIDMLSRYPDGYFLFVEGNYFIGFHRSHILVLAC